MQKDLSTQENILIEELIKEAEDPEGNIIKIAVDDLPYSHGTVARDVKTKKGAVLLPVGVDISMFEAAMETIIGQMKNDGIEHVYLNVHHEISDYDLNRIIEKVYSDGSEMISKEKAATVIKGVGHMFQSIRVEDITPEIINTVSNMSVELTEDLLKNPNVAFSLGKVKEADEYTFVHSFNVAVLTGYLADKVRPGDRDYVQSVVMGGLLHDMGKARIPLEILNKPGPLSSEEFAEMKKHPNMGMLMAINAGVRDPVIISVIGGHHEKWSGKGYPKGIKGNDIPECARVSAVADVFDALTAKRVYKSSMSSRNAITLILKDSGSHFDIKISRELLVGLGLYPPGSIVMLSDGRKGVVVSGGGSDLVRPVILMQENEKDETTPDIPVFLDLKATPDICITHYIGHSEKRDIGYNIRPLGKG